MSPSRIAVFVSGTGRHLDHFARLARAGELDCEIGLVFSNRAGVKALERAASFELETLVLDPEREMDQDTFSLRAFAAVEAARCETVLLAGFLRKLVLPERWRGRVLNIHPALLPSFGGKGFYGKRVHAAVLEAGVEKTGCTVHFVDNEYDSGPILLQREITVAADDTLDSLAARVFEEEKLALPDAIRRVLSGAAKLER